MHYLLLIYGEQSDLTPEEMEAEMPKWFDYGNWLTEKGWMEGGDALQGTETATTVRMRDGEVVTTDGPFAETKEQLGGYYQIKCENLDEAIEAASRIPSVGRGSIEIRPIQEFPES